MTIASIAGVIDGARISIVAGVGVVCIDAAGLRITGIIGAGVSVVAGDIHTVTCSLHTHIICSTSISVLAVQFVVFLDTTTLRVAGVVGAEIVVFADE